MVLSVTHGCGPEPVTQVGFVIPCPMVADIVVVVSKAIAVSLEQTKGVLRIVRCHLQGGATFVPQRETSRLGRIVLQSLAYLSRVKGLVCNYSICQQPCTVGEDDPQCPDEGRCVSLQESTGTDGGLWTA